MIAQLVAFALHQRFVTLPRVLLLTAVGVVLNRVVLVSSSRRTGTERLSVLDAVVRGCALRFRPIVVSGIVAVIGFIPAAIQRPPARVVVGGLISSSILTLLVLPVIHALIAERGERGQGAQTNSAGEDPR